MWYFINNQHPLSLRYEAVSKGKENANYAINCKFTQMLSILKSMVYRNGNLHSFALPIKVLHSLKNVKK